MKSTAVAFAACCAASCCVATMAAAAPQWQRVGVQQSGTSADIPVSIFSRDGGAADSGSGHVFYSADGSARLILRATPRSPGESPRDFLRRRMGRAGVIYQRVTDRFFVVSSIKGDSIWYDRCNFGAELMHCVLVSYPRARKRDWDDIITRISLSLRP